MHPDPLAGITDEHALAVMRCFSLTPNAERLAVLRCADSVDVRACPGSGKTTMLVAKLALLVSRWESRHTGMCVLSHTNVAHDEIRRRFPAFPALRRLEGHPHFVGTIQSFVDTFLGIPAAAALLKVRPRLIDDGASARRTAALLELRPFTSLAGWLKRNPRKRELVLNLGMVFTADQELIVRGLGDSLPSADSPVIGKQLKLLKWMVLKEGVFRFDDMDALSRAYVAAHPGLRQVLGRRFPVVFIDEAQDTKADQASLLTQLLSGHSVLQRFGDDRQAIYDARSEGDDADCVFPGPVTLPLRSSVRMSRSIAALVENVCMGAVEPIDGNAARADRPHTVFLFDRESIAEVLPRFAILVATTVGPHLPPTDVMAIGFRRQGLPGSAHAPCTLADYWSGFSPSATAYEGAACAADYYQAAMCRSATSTSAAFLIEPLIEAALRVLALQGVRDGKRLHTKASLLRSLAATKVGTDPFNRFLAQALDSANRSRAQWHSIKASMLSALEPLAPDGWARAVEVFFGEEGSMARAPHHTSNVLSMTCPEGLVQVGIDTIHAVKGRTLRAVLVLTTRYQGEHDLPYLVKHGFLVGTRPSQSARELRRLPGHVRRIFVAMSRPSDLLCLAMRRDHICDSDRDALLRHGWAVHSV